MKRRTGYVWKDEQTGNWRGRTTWTDPATKKRREKWVTGKTADDAWDLLDEFNRSLRGGGVTEKTADRNTFKALADDFRAAHLKPATFADGHKVAGYKDITSPSLYLTALASHFGKMKLTAIKPRHVEEFKLMRLQTPTKADVARGDGRCTRAIASVNRELEFLRTVFNWGKDNGWVQASPFDKSSTRRLIQRSRETKRERVPGFGEEMAILAHCTDDRLHLHDVLIVGADTGMRRGEIVQLSWVMGDVDLGSRIIRVRAEISKTGRERFIPMTERVFDVLCRRHEICRDRTKLHFPGLKAFSPDFDLVFFGLKEFKRSFGTACRLAGVEDLHFHDYSRHAFITRAILAGIPPAVVLKSSGHSSEEWKRYLNVSPDTLRSLWSPHGSQLSDEVRTYGQGVMRGIVQALSLDFLVAP